MTEEKQTEYNPPLIRRAHLAVFFGGIIASITVTIIGMLGVMIW